jgi:hypothetical protein
MEVLMRALLALCLAASCALSGAGLTAQTRDGHDAFHSWYQGLRSPEGDSCCNEKDCHPVDARYVEGAPAEWMLEIRIGGRWVRVPPQRILPQPSPDGGVHACYSDPAPFMTETTPGLVIRCVVTGGVS